MAGEVLQDHHGFVQASDCLHHPVIKEWLWPDNIKKREEASGWRMGKGGNVMVGMVERNRKGNRGGTMSEDRIRNERKIDKQGGEGRFQGGGGKTKSMTGFGGVEREESSGR